MNIDESFAGVVDMIYERGDYVEVIVVSVQIVEPMIIAQFIGCSP